MFNGFFSLADRFFSKLPPVFWQFFRFCLVGLVNFLVDFSIYFILTRLFGLPYLLAATISFAVAVTCSFFLNRRWTFSYQGANFSAVYFKFFLVNIGGLVLNLILMFVSVELVACPDLLAKFLASVVVAFFNFSLSKFWAFKN